MGKGKDFEAFVVVVERAMNGLPGVEVLHDVKMPTRYGGVRQIDILIKEDRARFIYKTIIECKNTNKKVTVNTVGAFKELIETVGAHQGIIVSAEGFQSGALLSAQEANIHLYQLSQVKELEEHLKKQRFIMYDLKHTSKEITVRFKEKKDINKQVTLYTEMFAPLLHRKIAIVDVAQDFFNKVNGSIADSLVIKVKDPLVPQITKANTKFSINFPSPIIFAKENSFTEIMGFDAEVETEMFTAPSDIKNVLEYKDIVQKRTYALVYEVEYDGETYKLLKQKT
jgi:hypothetical protein